MPVPCEGGAPHLRGLTPEGLLAAFGDLPIRPELARRITRRVVGQYRDDLHDIPGLSKGLAAALQARA